jgi:hypothetical protein
MTLDKPAKRRLKPNVEFFHSEIAGKYLLAQLIDKIRGSSTR